MGAIIGFYLHSSWYNGDKDVLDVGEDVLIMQ